jgi:uncharacterized repeat protein (TIGR01451 family)
MHRGLRPHSRLGRLAAVGGTVLILSSLFLSVGAAVASAADTGAKAPTDTVAPNGWTDPTNVFTNDASVATASGDNVDQGYRAFGFGVPNGSIIDGITVAVTARSTAPTGCQIQVRLSDNDGTTFTTRQTAELTDVDQVLTLGGATDTWGNVWDPSQLTNARFRLELRNNDPGPACDGASTTSVSFLTVQVTYRTITNGTANPPISTALCNTADFNFVIDMSGSIGPQGPAPSNLPALKAGIIDFVNTFQDAGGDGRYSGTRFNGSSAAAISSGYVTAADFIDEVNALSGPTGLTPTASGITTAAGNNAGGRTGVQNVMFVLTDGSPNKPNTHGDNLDVPETWLEGANAAIDAADSVRGVGATKFHIKAVYLSAPGDPGDISLPFSAAGDEAWAAAVMTEIGGGSFLDANFSSFADELFDIIRCPDPVPADIAITKVADDPTVDAGDPIGFTITVSNVGGIEATGVALTDALPAGGDLDWSIENQTGISGCSIAGAVGSQSIDCPTVSLAGGASYAIHIVSATSNASADTVPNTASVTSTNGGSDEDDDTIAINKSAINIVKTADDPEVEAGDTIGFTVTVTNNGAATATGVVVSDPLPTDQGLDWTLDDNAGGLCSLAAGSVTCGPTTLAPGASFSFHISSPTTDDTAETSPVLNVASVTTTNAGSDEDDADVIVEGGEVQPATGTPKPKPTLPPTDASSPTSGPGTSLLLGLIALAVLTLGVGVLTPVPATIRRRRDR